MRLLDGPRHYTGPCEIRMTKLPLGRRTALYHSHVSVKRRPPGFRAQDGRTKTRKSFDLLIFCDAIFRVLEIKIVWSTLGCAGKKSYDMTVIEKVISIHYQTFDSNLALLQGMRFSSENLQWIKVTFSKISEMDPPMSVDKVYTSTSFHKLGNRCPASCSQCSVKSKINIFAALIM